MADEKMGSNNKGQAWFCTTGLPSDVVIEVDDMTFHLHKFPLMSKSQKLHNMITEREQNPRTRDQEDCGCEYEEEIAEVEIPHISLPNFPGGSKTFEAAAKFCYHVKIDLTAGNAPALRCAAEYLEMTEEFSQDNLINRTERFLAHSIFRSLKSSIKALKSCESLSPMVEELGIVQRCIDSIAARANANASDAASSIFGWPMAEGGSGRDRDRDRDRDLRVSIRRKSAMNDGGDGGADLWLEELSALSLPIYKRVLAAMKEGDLSSEIIEGSLISYAKRSIPGLSRSNRHLAPARSTSELEQRELLETIITNLPLKKSLVGSNTTRFLFRLLRTINILRASEASRTALERKIASQLEQATLDDLLMPSYSYLVDTLYDVDSVERILNYYLVEAEKEEEETSSTAIVEAARSPAAVVESSNGMVRVGRLVDGYLAEIASDANLRPERFCDLAVALPDRARVYDDGLYRAVDLYLKAHPRISEEERDKVCSVMDCRKLTLEACTHAAQNERLPLRAVVQVLFFEQLQLRHAIAGTLLAANAAGPPPEEPQSGPLVPREGETWRTAFRENQVLRLDMDSMQSRVQELERECSDMRKAIEKVGRKGGIRAGTGPDRGSSVGRRFGCKFGTKVCDSQERTVLEPRKPQAEHHNNR